jgi:response regulator RpfG family c-di-GMP phosphodiesterase
MAKILIAASSEPMVICKRILDKHELICAESIAEAENLLETEKFDLIVCTVLFDESRMFDLLRFVKASRKWKRIPFLCCRLRQKALDYAVALESVQIACRALGADAFLDIQNYESDDPESELAEDIERFLPGKDRETAPLR